MKKLGLILIALVIALGAMGVGYAAWAQNLTINNNVETGFISASFIDYNVGTDPYAKLSGELSESGKDDAAGSPLTDVLNITIKDAYPGFNQTIKFKVVNNGTVPFYLTPGKVEITDANGVVNDVFSVTTDGVNPSLVVEPGKISGWYSYFLNVPGNTVTGYADPLEKHIYTVTIPLTATQYQIPE